MRAVYALTFLLQFPWFLRRADVDLSSVRAALCLQP